MKYGVARAPHHWAKDQTTASIDGPDDAGELGARDARKSVEVEPREYKGYECFLPERVLTNVNGYF